ncbi:MAG: response regulator [Saprospiraceae bacterium]|nr:response regulator [Saprospiraceae bacterium]
MQNYGKRQSIKVFLVDDDALFLKLLEIEYLQHDDFTIETYSTGELCIENLPRNPDIIVLDYHLDGIDKNAMNGMETLDKIKAYNPDIPVVILSSQDKIDVAIKCVAHRAIDYVVKSESAIKHLQTLIMDILNYKRVEKELSLAHVGLA